MKSIEKEELVIKTYLRNRSKEKKRPKLHPMNDRFYEQLMIPYYKRVHTFI